MIAIKGKDYNKYGCVNCGCDYCYSDGVSGPTTLVKCGECGENFFIANDNFNISSLGISQDGGLVFLLDNEDLFRAAEEFLKENKDAEYFTYEDSIFYVVKEHPRKGTIKHKFVCPDIRPDDGIGDYCTPRGVGYDVACFVKSKEAGQRITDMINKVNQEYNNKGFSCWLDYRENEPTWIQVKIDYPNELRALFLIGLIKENNNIITEDIVKNALDMEVNFKNYWKYKAASEVYKATDFNFLEDISNVHYRTTWEEKEKIFEETFQNTNYLDQFEAWGTSRMINYFINHDNMEMASQFAKHFVEISNDTFNAFINIDRAKKRDYIIDLRKQFIDELMKTANLYFAENKVNLIPEPEDLWTENLQRYDLELTEEETQELENDFEELKRAFTNSISEWMIRLSFLAAEGKKKSIKGEDKCITEYLPFAYQMYSLEGLRFFLEKNIHDKNYSSIVIAMEHVYNQYNSPLFIKLRELVDDKNQYDQKRIDETYELLNKLIIKYKNLANKKTDDSKKLIRK